MAKDGNPEDERRKLTRAETMNILTDAIAKVAIERIDQMGQRLSEEATKSDNGSVGLEKANLLKKQLAPTLSLATQRATAGIEKAHKDSGPVLDAEALSDFKSNQAAYSKKMSGLAEAKDFSDDKNNIAEQIRNLKNEVNSFKDNLKKAQAVRTVQAEKTLSPAAFESVMLINEQLAKVAYKEINNLEKALAGSGSSVNPESLRWNFKPNMLKAVEKVFEDEQFTKKLDPATLENYKRSAGEHVERMITKLPTFSGSKEEVAESMTNLKNQVKEFTSVVEKIPMEIPEMTSREDSKAKLHNKPAATLEPSIKPISKEKEKSSVDTWNLLVEKAADVARTEFDKTKSSVMIPAMIAFQNEKLSSGIQKTFEAELKSYISEHELNPKTVDAFKKNSEAYFKEMLKNSESSIEAKTNEFKAKTTIDINDIKSNWKTVGEFLKSKNMDRLAEFCNDKHIETAAKKISKELDQNLSKDHGNIKSNSNVKYYKPHGTDHGM